MLISFTQTYGNDRKRLLDIYFRDKKLHEFKNLCDINFYSFHNSNDDIVNYFIDKNPVKNTQILRFNGISYTQCVKNLLQILENLKCTHLFFIQDDAFSDDNDDINFEELVNYIKEQKNQFMLSFCAGYCMHLRIPKDNLKSLKTFNNFAIYENNCMNYEHIYNMDDSSYIASIDIVKQVYDKAYFMYNDIWNAEGYLNRRFKTESMPRNMSSRHLFKPYNIIGRNAWNPQASENELRTKNLL
jgi:hypothetical protein